MIGQMNIRTEYTDSTWLNLFYLQITNPEDITLHIHEANARVEIGMKHYYSTNQKSVLSVELVMFIKVIVQPVSQVMKQ